VHGTEETVQAEVRGGSQERRSETMGVGLVKEAGFKSGVKDRWSYRCRPTKCLTVVKIFRPMRLTKRY